MNKYIDSNPELGKQFYKDFNSKGKIVMLNLLRFKKIADYTGIEGLTPEKDITGKDAYELYMKSTLPILEKAGSRVLFQGESKGFLIGPEDIIWDAVLLVEHESVTKFIELSQNQEYLKTAGHRQAALEDSRLLPISENSVG